ncbi:MAG: hypothetical protein IMF05_03025 [Proteobacteria bacterium]|nr:hypothetical protein [Pseudomonadota bacterium]
MMDDDRPLTTEDVEAGLRLIKRGKRASPPEMIKGPAEAIESLLAAVEEVDGE